MNLGDIKIFMLNTFTLSLTSLTNLEMGLKIILLIVSIGYTVVRWINLKNQDGKTKDK